MRKKKDGLTLGEKIEKNLEKIKKSKDAVSVIDDSFLSRENEGGIVWYVRRCDLLSKSGRKLDIIDEE